MKTPPFARPGLDLFAISGTLLFLELACIRWFPAHVMFLTFFTNTVLLACFVGMSAGCLAARRPGRYLRYTPVWIAVAVAAGMLVNRFRERLATHVQVGDQKSPDVVFFGTETSSLTELSFALPVELIAGTFFLLIAAVMVGPGQEMGRAFDRVGSRPRAYTLNLLGSLVGIGLFALCSALHLSPPAWFGVAAVGLAYFLLRKPNVVEGASRPMPRLLTAAVLVAGVLGTVWTSGLLDYSGSATRTTWSPYYRIDYAHQSRVIVTNLVSHQLMEPRESRAVAAYALPYLFQRDVKTDDGRQAWQKFERVLVIGAGSGNDVSRAVQWCGPNAKIDAVEIDPVIQNIGSRRHPDKPYQDPRVTVHLTDGRNFLRTAPAAEYDLVVFALVDSLVLHSGYSNLRLESYLFTQESFADVRRVLKPSGVAAVYNFFRQGWLVARIRDQLRAAFACNPVVLTDPPQPMVPLDMHCAGFTAMFAGGPQVIDPMFRAFERVGNNYWVPFGNAVGLDSNSRFAVTPPSFETRRNGPPGAPHWIGLHMAYVPESPAWFRPATDDWPFLYVLKPSVPSQTWKGVALTAGLGLLVFAAAGAFRRGPAVERRPAEWGNLARSFLLGAGFMLIETKAVVHMALLFGSTWTVNTVVFAAILVMSLVGSLFAAWRKPTSLVPYYAGLFLSLAVNVAVPMSAFLGMNATAQVVLCGLLTFAPVAFAGVIFAVTFNRSADPGKLFGANVAGALVGGLAENLSLLVGFRMLGLVAAGFYALSAVAGIRVRRSAATRDDGYNEVRPAGEPNVTYTRLTAAEPTGGRLTQTALVGEAEHGGDVR